ncbi:hypothetical protein [Ancylobacter sp.]|uniref:hypothetical protein n=1 Tax=Ancylobacter sp. TaxID=1872567 RepID=UPI003C7E0A99
MDTERPFTISSACEALGIKVERFKSLRRRDHLPFADLSTVGPDGEDRGGWTRYSASEIALTSALVELVDVMKLDVVAASRLLANARGAFEGEHPQTAKPFADIWIGALIFGGDEEGRAHIGGTLEEVNARILKETAVMAAEHGAAPSQIVLVNLSKHVRKIDAALAKVA